MIEKVNPDHPDKVADRIAGALVDLAYSHHHNPAVAIEVLLGHGLVTIVAESSFYYDYDDIRNIVYRIMNVDSIKINIIQIPQDQKLSLNQRFDIRCGDNGIFRGVPLTDEQKLLSYIARTIYSKYPSDGKYILDQENDKLIICQSNAIEEDLHIQFPSAIINPLGHWTGGPNVDAGATNRKLGSDMADSVTGGGLHGKDLSKADVSVNIYAFLKAQETQTPVELCCAIGDNTVDGKPYSDIVEIARQYIASVGGFEKFAEWGLF